MMQIRKGEDGPVQTITEEERATINNACFVANERFRESIKELEATDMPAEGKARLVAQFKHQIEQTGAIMEKFD